MGDAMAIAGGYRSGASVVQRMHLRRIFQVKFHLESVECDGGDVNVVTSAAVPLTENTRRGPGCGSHISGRSAMWVKTEPA
jgi:hypothetical protein